jgi:hypothetical protein
MYIGICIYLYVYIYTYMRCLCILFVDEYVSISKYVLMQ